MTDIFDVHRFIDSSLIHLKVSYFLAAWAHLACALSDPGAVPRGAAEALAPEAEVLPVLSSEICFILFM